MCSYDCSAHPTEFNEDNDITGIGVLIGYCATAGIAVFIIVFHYFACYEPRVDPFRESQANRVLFPRSRSNPIDDIVLRGPREVFNKTFGAANRGSRSHIRLEESLIKCILSMSDIQIITGISIIISGATQLKCGISTYQWQVLVYLAWFSSLTHLSCLTLLRKYLARRPAERLWRLICMFILVVLLILAFLPTANYRWQYGPAKNTGRPKPQDLAICYLKPVKRLNAFPDPTLSSSSVQNDHTFSDHAIIAMSISVILVFLGFVLRVVKLYQSPSTFLTQTIRGKISDFLRKPLRIIDAWCGDSGYFDKLGRLLLYRPLLALFLTARIMVDIWDSMFFEVLWLILSFVWGVERLFSVVRLFPSKENLQWSFGQVMSVALLAIPLITIFEFLYPEPDTQVVGETRGTMGQSSVDGSDNCLDPQDSRQLPVYNSRDMEYRSFSDHPDDELYYTSGYLTAPSLTLILTIVSLSVWTLTRGFLLNGLEDMDFLQISFYPWGVIPLILVFCGFSSILFSFLVAGIESNIRCNKGEENFIVRSLPTLIIILLAGTTFVMYAYSSATATLGGWISLGVLVLYCLCSFFISARK